MRLCLPRGDEQEGFKVRRADETDVLCTLETGSRASGGVG